MNSRQIAIIRTYWLTMVGGYILSFGVFLTPIQSWGIVLWVLSTNAISVTGLVMVTMGYREISQKETFRFRRHLLFGMGTAVVAEVCVYFGSYPLGFLILYMFYLYWISFLIAGIYYGIKVFRMSGE